MRLYTANYIFDESVTLMRILRGWDTWCCKTSIVASSYPVDKKDFRFLPQIINPKQNRIPKSQCQKFGFSAYLDIRICFFEILVLSL
jgi:hypothetical protein